MAEFFTEDIVIEILLRLPAKSLMRFKCVGKHWRSLISDPGFAKSHLQRIKAGDRIPSQRIINTGPLKTIDYKALDGGIGGDDDRAVIEVHELRMALETIDYEAPDGGVGGDDGRAVVEVHELRMALKTIDYEAMDGGTGGDDDDRAVVEVHELRMAHEDHGRRDPYIVGSCDGLVCLSDPGSFFVPERFLVYNPTTKESRDLCGSDLLRRDNLFYGFGYDSRSDDYKIVQGSGFCEKLQVTICSLKSGSWRRVRLQGKSRRILLGPGLYWNGALHWCVTDWWSKKREYEIMSFDLSEEKFHQVLSVPEVHGDVLFDGFGIHGADLIIYGASERYFEAWITNEQGRGGSWTKLFSALTSSIPGFRCGMIPVAYTRSGKMIFLNNMNKMILFDPKDNTSKDCLVQGAGNVRSVIYLETLVSPYLGCEPPRI